jgi:hypothetical protein
MTSLPNYMSGVKPTVEYSNKPPPITIPRTTIVRERIHKLVYHSYRNGYNVARTIHKEQSKKIKKSLVGILDSNHYEEVKVNNDQDKNNNVKTYKLNSEISDMIAELNRIIES